MTPDEIRTEAVRLAPPAGVSVTSIMGIPLSDWVYIATIVYILVQCVCLIFKTIRNSKGEKKDAE